MNRLFWKNWLFLLTSLCLSTQCFAVEVDEVTSDAGGRVPVDLLRSVTEVPAAIQHSAQDLRPVSHCDNRGTKRKPEEDSGLLKDPSIFGSPKKRPNRLSLPSGGYVFDYRFQLDYNDGDLLYGLQTSREATLSSLKRDYSEGKAFTVDVFNNLILEHFRAPGEGLNTNTSSIQDRLTDLVQRGKLHKSDSARFERYLLFLGREMSVEMQKMKSDDFIREACILAIFFTAHERRKIHFVLDGFDVSHVVNDNQRHFGSYTSHELRAIVGRYREDPSILNSIDFYEAGERFDQGKKERFLKSLLGAEPGQFGISPHVPNEPPEVLREKGSAVKEHAVQPAGNLSRQLDFLK
jgi:hypothetical protein